MITELKGMDIFNVDAHTLACPVNTYGIMGAGLAKAFVKKDPRILGTYRTLCDIGSFYYKPLAVHPFRDDQQVLYFPTKYHWRNKSSLSLIEFALKYLSAENTNLGIRSLALPKLGAGLGSLPWEEVKKLIYKHLSDMPYPVYLLT